MTHELTIDQEFVSLCPRQTDEELDELRKSLEEDGCREPIIVWANHDNTILDGHTRYELCQSLEVPYKLSAITLEDRHAAINWIIRNQLGRRNATEEQKAYLRGKWYNEEKKEVGRPIANKLCHNDTISTADRIGKATGVASRTVNRDATFATAVDALAEKSPVLKDAALKGDIPKNAVAKLADAPKAELRKLEKHTGTDLRKEVREVVTPPKSGQPKSNANKLVAEITASIGRAKNRADELNRTLPHRILYRQFMADLNNAESTLNEWKRSS